MDSRSKALYLKVAFIVLNVLLALIGVRYIGFSLYEWVQSAQEYFDPFKLYTQVAIGASLLLISFLGNIAVGRTTPVLMCSYIVCLLILLGLQLYLHSVVGEPFQWAWSHFVYSHTLVDSIEQQHNCCGKYGAEDYLLSGRAIPLSCYKDHKNISSNLHSLGCLEAIGASVMYYGFGGLLFKCVAFILQLLPLCLALNAVITVDRQLCRKVSVTSLLKLTLIVLNVLLMLIGIGYIASAIYEWTTTPRIVGDTTIVVQLIVGIFLLLNSGLSCFAVHYTSLLLMWSYITCMLALLGLQVFVFIEDPFRWLWSRSAHNTRLIANIEQKYDCCGLIGWEDYTSRNISMPTRCFRGCLKAMGSYVEFSGTGDFIIKRRVFIMQLFPLGLAMYLVLKRPKKQLKEEVVNTLTLLPQP